MGRFDSLREGHGAMLPNEVSCEVCGRKAKVRGIGRVEYAWKRTGGTDEVDIRSARLTVDCPTCGVQVQEFHPSPTSSNVVR
jgi:hypothetical protein